MITPQRKRQLRSKVHMDVIKAISLVTENDEEFLFALLNAQQYISNAIAGFDDMFDAYLNNDVEEEEE